MLQPASEQGDMYISFWIKLQPDLQAKMTPQTWYEVFEWKTGGDYRVTCESRVGTMGVVASSLTARCFGGYKGTMRPMAVCPIRNFGM